MFGGKPRSRISRLQCAVKGARFHTAYLARGYARSADKCERLDRIHPQVPHIIGSESLHTCRRGGRGNCSLGFRPRLANISSHHWPPQSQRYRLVLKPAPLAPMPIRLHPCWPGTHPCTKPLRSAAEYQPTCSEGNPWIWPTSRTRPAIALHCTVLQNMNVRPELAVGILRAGSPRLAHGPGDSRSQVWPGREEGKDAHLIQLECQGRAMMSVMQGLASDNLSLIDCQWSKRQPSQVTGSSGW